MTNAAVLVNLTIRAFVNERSDRKIVSEVAKAHGASGSFDRYLKKRLPPRVLLPIDRILARARQYHNKVTSPWYPGGVGMMPASYILDYQKTMASLDGELQQEVQLLCSKLSRIDAELKRKRGTLYVPVPTKDDLKHAWEIDVELLPVPQSEDFRIEFLEQRTINKFDKKSKERFAQQDEHVKEILWKPLNRLKSTLLKASPRVRASTIENLEWACIEAPKLALNKKLIATLEKCAKEVQGNILPNYNPKGRPKFDMEAIENALESIDKIEGWLNA